MLLCWLKLSTHPNKRRICQKLNNLSTVKRFQFRSQRFEPIIFSFRKSEIACPSQSFDWISLFVIHFFISFWINQALGTFEGLLNLFVTEKSLDCLPNFTIFIFWASWDIWIQKEKTANLRRMQNPPQS